MTVSTLFFENRRLLVLLVGVILVAGLSALQVLPRREDPELTPRNALVVTRYPGADAERVEKLVTEKLEDVLEEFEEVKKLVSTSRRGISTISVELEDEITDAERVWSEMRDDLDAVRSELPSAAGEPVLDDLDIDASTMILALAWDGPGEPRVAVVQRYADELADRLRRLPGTKEARLFGFNREEIAVHVAAGELAARGLTPGDVARAVRGSDAKVGAGRYQGATSDLGIEVRGELESLDQVRDLPIRYGEGDAVVRLGDLGRVSKTIADPPRELALIDGRRGVAVSVLMQSSERVDRWGAGVDRLLADFEASAPGSVTVETLFDQRRYTQIRLRELAANLALGAALVVAVVLALMGWRSALVVGLALPLSAFVVIAGMRALGIPLHQMSVTGLIIALGLLIDNAIVMVDEVRHRLAAGAAAAAAVGAAVRTLFVPLLGSTVTTVLSFMPIALMPGPAGEFVGTIAVSVTLALLGSLGLALTVVPAATALLEGTGRRGRTWWSRGWHGPRLTRMYAAGLGTALRHPALSLATACLLPAAGFLAAGGLTEQFFPPADRDQLPIELRLDPQASIEQTRAVAEAARERLLAHPGVARVHWFLGTSAPKFYYNMLENESGVPWFGHALVQLEKAEGAFELMRALQRELDEAFPQAQLLVRPLEQGPPFQAPVEVHVQGRDLDTLRGLGERVRRELSAITGVTHTRATLAEGVPLLAFDPDEEVVNLVGLDRRTLAGTLESYLDGASGGSLVEGPEELPVRVRVSPATRSDLAQLTSLDVRTAPRSAGDAPEWLPLSAVATHELTPVPGDIEHLNGVRTNTIQGYLTAGRLPATVLEPLRAILADLELPAGYRIRFGGEAEQRERAVGNLMASVGVLLTLMIATLVLSFRSFRLAAVIGAVGVASVGLGLGSLRLFGHPFGFMAIVGTMGLIGVAINDSIVVLAAIRDDESARRGDLGAIAGVVLRSTRHVIATTLTTAAGFVPLLCAGGGFWPPVAVIIGGGVIGATLLAILLVPATYVLLHGRQA